MDYNSNSIYTIFESGGYRYKLIGDEESLLSLEVEKSSQVQLVSKLDENLTENSEHFKEVKLQLESYMAGELKEFDLEIDVQKLDGTDFQKEVWTSLCNIPFGVTCSYKELSSIINRPKAHRAVGLANGKNPIPIIIPCHRVVSHNGGLGGYALGKEFKMKLLRLESSNNLLF
ncbi:methylated-DNA--[protein]-cysteine S-methyltransferase [bacterium]|nr:methylated-DNA--[protein]-cysteine S-methyltransferase [bacterium]